MIEINLQFFGGRGASSSSGGATGGVSQNDILSVQSLVSAREGNQALVDETLGVFRQVNDEYGAQVTDIQLATMKKSSNAIAYYDSEGNIAINERFFDRVTMDTAYAKCVESGFHPSNGNRTALEAVVAHELGHKLTADVADRIGMKGFMGLDGAAQKIVAEARRGTKHKSNGEFGAKISGYAKFNAAETIAEAFSDVFCNGKKAKSESRAVVRVLDGYLKSSSIPT